MTADDYAHVIIACLTHDIGYVRGLFKDDDEDGFVVDATGRKVTLPRGASDASLMPHHVDRSKLYVMERIEGIAPLDKERIARRDRRHQVSSRWRARNAMRRRRSSARRISSGSSAIPTNPEGELALS